VQKSGKLDASQKFLLEIFVQNGVQRKNAKRCQALRSAGSRGGEMSTENGTPETLSEWLWFFAQVACGALWFLAIFGAFYFAQCALDYDAKGKKEYEHRMMQR